MRRNKFFEIDEKKIKTIDIDEMYKYYEKWSEYFISSTKIKVNYPQVKNINKVILELKELNINILSDHPTTGVEGNKVVFIHPKSTGGVLVELAEKTS